MLNSININRVCISCAGNGSWGETVGEDPVSHDPCERCGGTGYEDFYKVVLPENYFYSTDVISCIEADEYNALTDAQKQFVGVIISSGIINLNDGSTELTKLTSFFGGESDTIANINSILS